VRPLLVICIVAACGTPPAIVPRPTPAVVVEEPRDATLEPRAFCTAVYGARGRGLEERCTAEERSGPGVKALLGRDGGTINVCEKELTPLVEDGVVTLTAARAEACGAALRALPWKQSFATSTLDGVPACRSILRGTLAAGASCKHSIQCGEGLFCKDTCRPLAAAGETCEPVDLLGSEVPSCTAGHACRVAASERGGIGLRGSGAGSWFDLDSALGLGLPATGVMWGDDFTSIGRIGGIGTGVAQPKTPVTGSQSGLPPEVVQRIVRSHHAEMRRCYTKGLETNPDLHGRVAVRFAIAVSGAVSEAKSDAATTLPDPAVVGCILGVFRRMTFPAPKNIVKVSYPLVFAQAGEDEPAPEPSAPTAPPEPPSFVCAAVGAPTNVRSELGAVGAPCSGAHECNGACAEGKCIAFCGLE
jgi:hypothetical protein